MRKIGWDSFWGGFDKSYDKIWALLYSIKAILSKQKN